MMYVLEICVFKSFISSSAENVFTFEHFFSQFELKLKYV